MRWFPIRFRSYGADSAKGFVAPERYKARRSVGGWSRVFVSTYKDLTPTEPFLDSLFRLLRRGNAGEVDTGGPF
jgi:hypothetical protein